MKGKEIRAFLVERNGSSTGEQRPLWGVALREKRSG
jgi:hypothetical protein